MNCKYCGNEIPDGATFCSYCGNRVDGKQICPSCGNALPEDNAFCSYCGAKLKQTEIHEETAAAEASTAPAAAKTSTADVKNILSLTAISTVLVGAILGFIFTFLIGMKLSQSGVSQTITIYDYFGKAYEGLDQVATLYGGDIGIVLSFYVPTVIGTAISLAAIIGAIVGASITLKAAVDKFSKHLDVNVEKPALITALFYVFAATVFNATLATSVTGTTAGPSGATQAGLALTIIALIGYAGIKLVLYFMSKPQFSVKTIIYSAISVCVCLTVFGLLSGADLSLSATGESVSTSFFGISSAYAVSAMFLSENNSLIIICLATVGFISKAVLLYLFIKGVANNFAGIGGAVNRKLVNNAVSGLVLSLVYAGCAVASLCIFREDMGVPQATLGIAVPVVVVIFAIANLVLAVLNKSGDKALNV